MSLSRREVLIVVVAVLSVGLLAADRYVITPIMESGEALENERLRLMGELENAARLFERRRLMARRWQEMRAGGLVSDPSDAEGRVLQAVRDWAQEAGLAVSSVRPQRAEQDSGIGEITVLAAGSGPMRAVARFLWRTETTALPLRVRELQIGSRAEAQDDLSLQVKLSTLYWAGGLADAAGEGDES
jgi:hypothetical protein